MHVIRTVSGQTSFGDNAYSKMTFLAYSQKTHADGQVAAEAFLTFFSTWLVYVFINEYLVKDLVGDFLVPLEKWLDQQGSLYSVKDYYLGLTSWEEVARQMLGFYKSTAPL